MNIGGTHIPIAAGTYISMHYDIILLPILCDSDYRHDPSRVEHNIKYNIIIIVVVVVDLKAPRRAAVSYVCYIMYYT